MDPLAGRWSIDRMVYQFHRHPNALSTKETRAAFWPLWSFKECSRGGEKSLPGSWERPLNGTSCPSMNWWTLSIFAGYQNQVIDAVIGHVGRRVDQNLPALLPSNVRRMISNYARQVVGNEVALVAEEMISRIKEQVGAT